MASLRWHEYENNVIPAQQEARSTVLLETIKPAAVRYKRYKISTLSKARQRVPAW